MTPLGSLLVAWRVGKLFRVFASGTVICCYFRYGSRKNKANEILFHRTIPDLVLNIWMFVGSWGPEAGRGSTLCQAQGGAIEWARAAAFLWTAYACYCLVVVVCTVRNFAHHQRITSNLKVAVYGVPLFVFSGYLLMLAGAGPVFGGTTLWCQIDENQAIFQHILHSFEALLMFLSWLAIILAVRRVFLAHRRSAAGSIRVLRERSIKRYVVTLTAMVITSAVEHFPMVVNFFVEIPMFSFLVVNVFLSFVTGIATFAILYYSTFAYSAGEDHVWHTEATAATFDDHTQLDPYFKLSADGGDSPTVDLRTLGEVVKDCTASLRTPHELPKSDRKLKVFLTRIRAGQRRSLGPGPFASGGHSSRGLLVPFLQGIQLARPSNAVLLPSWSGPQSPDFPTFTLSSSSTLAGAPAWTSAPVLPPLRLSSSNLPMAPESSPLSPAALLSPIRTRELPAGGVNGRSAWDVSPSERTLFSYDPGLGSFETK